MSRRLLVAVFEREEDILGAARAAREEGLPIVDVYTPFAVHGLDKAMGLKPSRLPWICFALGLLGAVLKLYFQIWTGATNWPMNVGGKPFVAVPAYIPVTFEIMVLFAGVGTVLAMFWRCGLRPGKKAALPAPRITDDRFVLVTVEADAVFDLDKARRLFAPYRPVSLDESIEEVP